MRDLKDIQYRLNPNQERMDEIIIRLEYIDVKRFKFIDGEITSEEYEPYRTEALALREEYRELEVL